MKKKLYLITLDQQPLRKSAISELEVWHEKIELLENKIQKFHETDLKLYNDWQRLTLGALQAEIEQLIDKYKKLALFHNWVVLTADEKNISLPHAFFLMSEEEQKFQKGSSEEKEKIEKLRKERSDKIEAELEPESEDDFIYDGDDGEDGDELESHFDQDKQDPNNNRQDDEDDDDWINNKEREILFHREKFKKEIIFFESLTDKKIIKIMRQFDEGFNLMSDCVYICSLCYRFDIVDKIWSFAPLKIKTNFNSDFKRLMGMSLDQYLTNVKNNARRASNSDENDDEFNFKAHFENPFSEPKNQVLPENVEAAKIIYRRIVMKIHPDKLSTEFAINKKNWLDRLWKKIHTAYDKADVKALQNLHLQILVTLKKYDDLDYSDLKAGAQLLQSELTRIEKSHEETLQHPAWGFSKLKSYKKLEKIIAEPYKKTSKDLKKDIKRIEDMHEALKDFVDSVQARGGFGQRRRRKPAQRRKRRQSTEDLQMNLY